MPTIMPDIYSNRNPADSINNIKSSATHIRESLNKNIVNTTNNWKGGMSNIRDTVYKFSKWLDTAQCYSIKSQDVFIKNIMTQYNTHIDSLQNEADNLSKQIESEVDKNKKRSLLTKRIKVNCQLVKLMNKRLQIRQIEPFSIDAKKIKELLSNGSQYLNTELTETINSLSKFRDFVQQVEIDKGFYSAPLSHLISNLSLLKNQWSIIENKSLDLNHLINNQAPKEYFRDYGYYLDQADGPVELAYRHSVAQDNYAERVQLQSIYLSAKENYKKLAQLDTKNPNLRHLREKYLHTYLKAESDLLNHIDNFKKFVKSQPPSFLEQYIDRDAPTTRRGKVLWQCSS